jgi:signal transduction histidine kinase
MAGLVVLLLGALALVEGWRLLRDARRARRLNRAVHELRRPLQAIALSLHGCTPDLVGAEACLRQARCALRELDAAINGGCDPSDPSVVRPARILEIAEALDLRWRFADVEVEPPARDQEIEADPDRLGAALDNLVANALRHGTGVVSVRTVSDGGKARFEVRDSGPRPNAAFADRDPRHGHGVGVVAEVAAAHGGAFVPARRESRGGTLAAISLPVARRGATG